MRYLAHVRQPELGYKDTWLWLPKKKVSLQTLQNSLELLYSVGSEERVLRMWRDEKDHILVPRAFIEANSLDYEVKDLRPEFPKVEFKSSVELDALNLEKSTQRNAFSDLTKSDGGLIVLSCGSGKTVLMCHAIAHWGQPTLIVNDKEHILHQWKEEIERFLSFDGEIGWIQGKPDKWRWKHPITLGMLKSLSKYSDKLPIGMSEWFGRIVWDEIHHLSAPTFSRTAALFPGSRYGATATPNRPDGTDVLYRYHVGPVIHENLSQEVIPKVLFKRSHTEVDFTDPKVRLGCYARNGDVHHRKMAAYVGTLPEEMDLCSRVVQRALDRGRRIIALSLSRDQVIALHERFTESGMIIGGNPKSAKDRLDVLRNNQLVFATTDMAQEALNERRLDSLVLLNEFSSENILQQTVGRIQRPDGNKMPSKVVVIFHARIPPMRAMGANLMKHCRRWGFEVETVN